ncbi:MAG: D-2-hydroxyacid dehydrogenase [Clostridia bacterium]|nr:D-2-hydroxyacid dehydrogenase [Clostridia bacterium]
MENQHILVMLRHINEEQKAEIEQLGPQCQWRYASKQTVSVEDLEWAHVIVGDPGRENVMKAKNLRFLQTSSAGVEGWLKPGVLKEDVILASGTGTFGVPISEYMVSAVLMLCKNLHIFRDQQKQHLWSRIGRYNNKSVYGSVALCLGAGDIGSNFLKNMKALGCTTIGVRRTEAEAPPYVDEMVTIDRLDEVLPKADIIGMALPHTPQTIGIMNRERIFSLKEDAVLVNVGRGTAVDTMALYEALQSGRIRGAVLDVTDPEPLPEDHPLWDLENVVITPHCCSAENPYQRQRSFEVCCENLKAYLNGEPIPSLIDRETGYRVSPNGR